MSGAKTVATERLLLERWHEGIRSRWVELNANPLVARWLGTGEPIERSISEAEFDVMLEHWREHGFGFRSVVEKNTGEWAGAVGLAHIGANPAGLPPEDVEIGWWFLPDYWGRGYATEAALAVRDEGFSGRFVEHFWARTNLHNEGSWKVMERIGMTFVRDGTGVADVPIRIYEMTRRQWQTLQK